MKRVSIEFRAESGYTHVVMLDNISHLEKSSDGELTYIYTKQGTRLTTTDSINTLNARINSES